MPEVSEQGLYPAEHRALRELHATARALRGHWEGLASRIGGEPAGALRAGAATARELLAELVPLTAQRGIQGLPAAQGAGRTLAGVRSGATDRLLERNQALRLAVLDAAHVATLLDWLATLAERRGDDGLAAFHRRWAARISVVEENARAAVRTLASDPDRAIAPADPSPLGRAGQRLGAALGSAGEAFDGSRAGRALRRRRREG